MNASSTAVASLPALVAQRATARPDKTILRRKDRGIWKAVSWSQLISHTQEIGQALVDFGLGRGDTAAILSETRPETVYADLAIQGTGAASVIIHPEDEADRIEQILQASKAKLVFAESEEQLDKILPVRDRCPALSRIVIFDMKGLREFSDRQCISLLAFTARGGDGTDWTTAAAGVTPEQPAVMLFPRDPPASAARVLNHREVLQMVATASSRLPLRPHDERLVVLRMADMAERIWGLYAALDSGCISNYLESPDTAAENLQELQPTVLGADAEAWSHLHDRATRSAKGATRTQRIAYNWALRGGRAGGIATLLANMLVLRAVRRELGLSRLRLAYVGGEPVSAVTQDWATCLGITIHRIGEPASAGDQPGPKFQALMQGAHA